jgi:hypothetical protein
MLVALAAGAFAAIYAEVLDRRTWVRPEYKRPIVALGRVLALASIAIAIVIGIAVLREAPTR